MTVESVTAAAGTTRPSFYRRFASVAHLQMEVIEMELPIPEFAPTADLAADLTQIDDTVSMVCASHYIRRYGSSLIFLALTDPVLAQRWNAHFRASFHAQISAALSAAIPQSTEAARELCAGYLSELMVSAPLMEAILSNGHTVVSRQRRGVLLSDIARLIATQPTER